VLPRRRAGLAPLRAQLRPLRHRRALAHRRAVRVRRRATRPLHRRRVLLRPCRCVAPRHR
jgi:hypothetical protein